MLSVVLAVTLLSVAGCGTKTKDNAAQTEQTQTVATDQQQPAAQSTAETAQPAADAQQPGAEAGKTVQDQAKPSNDKTASADSSKPAAEQKPAVTPAAKSPFEEYLDTLPGKLNPEKVKGKTIVYQFNITDGHPGQYWVKIENEKCTTGKGTVSNPSVTINVGEQLWLDMASGKVNGTTAYLTKKFTASGNTTYLSDMKKYFS